jgi:hypothetical protein
MNLMLVRLGYPPAIVRQEQRSRYLDALDRAGRCAIRRPDGTWLSSREWVNDYVKHRYRRPAAS